jgi:predicted metal-dependent phosphoesterase TrpH
MVNYDLHTHTTFSDGAHPLEITVKFAESMGLDAIVITDHPRCF